MSLPQRLYNLGCLIAKCELVRTKMPTDDNRLELQRLLNETIPVSSEEATQRDLVRGMYYSNQTEFTTYVNQPKNRVRALIYWTESKQIARALGLLGKVHIKWAADSGYTVDVFVPRSLRQDTAETSGLTSNQPDNQNGRRNYRNSKQPKRGARTGRVERDYKILNRQEKLDETCDGCCDYQNEPVSVEEYLAQPDDAVPQSHTQSAPAVLSVPCVSGLSYSEAVRWCDATD